MTRRAAIVSDASGYVGPELARVLGERGHALVLGDPAGGLVAGAEGPRCNGRARPRRARLSRPDASDQGVMRSGRRRLTEPVFGQTGRPGIEKRTMSTGTVKFFNDERGFGFISREVGEDVFVHHSNIEGAGHRSLAEGDRVEFETGPGRKGEEARNVRVL